MTDPIDHLAERLVNLSLSIAEQSGDTQRFLKVRRFIEDNFYEKQILTIDEIEFIYEASNRYGLKQVIELVRERNG